MDLRGADMQAAEARDRLAAKNSEIKRASDVLAKLREIARPLEPGMVYWDSAKAQMFDKMYAILYPGQISG